MLRIICMVLIIAHHYAVHGAFVFTELTPFVNKMIVVFFKLGGKLGVNLFVLISGYFMVRSSVTFRKLLRLWLQILFYSVTISAALFMHNPASFSLKNFVLSFFPVSQSIYWFATTYLILMVFSPLLNRMIFTMEQKTHFFSLLVLFGLTVIIQIAVGQAPGYSLLLWFVFLYLLAAYIRLYPIRYFDTWKNFLIAAAAYCLVFFGQITLGLLPKKGFILSRITDIFSYESNGLLLFVCSVTLFLAFMRLKPHYNRGVNLLARSMFGVYLIHDSIIVRPVLWKQIFPNNDYVDSPYLIFHALAKTAVVLIACTLIDQARMWLLEKPFFKLIDQNAAALRRLGNWAARKLDRFYSFFCQPKPNRAAADDR